MTRPWKWRATTRFGFALALLATWALGGGRADAAVIHVDVGESIQTAIDAAAPGDTIVVAAGTYHENLAITKNHITLRGAGKHADGTVLMPAATPNESPCTSEDAGVLLVDGICIAGAFDPVTFELGDPVVGTKVRGFLVEGFTGFGVILLNANNSRIARVQARNNEGYGISGFVLSGVEFAHNWAHDNGEPGFYIGDSPHADAVVVGNRAEHNQIGLLLRDASWGVVRDNRLRENCVGLVVLDTSAPDHARHWRIKENGVNRNNEACAGHPDEGEPPLSGAGIALLGADRVNVLENRVFRNRATGESVVTGGIIVASNIEDGYVDRPHRNRVNENEVSGNKPADIVWDRTGTENRFGDNDCGTSQPAWICD